MCRLSLVAAVLVAACGVSDDIPTATPQPLTVPQLKYRVMDELGRPWFCDPDFHPIARADEGDLARQRFPELQKDADTFSAIVARLKLSPAPPYDADQQLGIYREWKTLRALELQPVNDVWGFAYLAQKSGGGGERVDGRVSLYGRVTVLSRTAAGAPPCPICLALGTRIATPRGETAVQDLRAGDVVWTIDERGERVHVPLVAIASAPVPSTHDLVRLALEDGRVVFVSPGHPLPTDVRSGTLARETCLTARESRAPTACATAAARRTTSFQPARLARIGRTACYSERPSALSGKGTPSDQGGPGAARRTRCPTSRVRRARRGATDPDR